MACTESRHQRRSAVTSAVNSHHDDHHEPRRDDDTRPDPARPPRRPHTAAESDKPPAPPDVCIADPRDASRHQQDTDSSGRDAGHGTVPDYACT